MVLRCRKCIEPIVDTGVWTTSASKNGGDFKGRRNWTKEIRFEALFMGSKVLGNAAERAKLLVMKAVRTEKYQWPV